MHNTLGKRMKWIRENKNLKQNKVAKDLSITPYQLSRYETGKNKPDPDMIAKIAIYYDVSSDYLLGLTDDDAPINRDEKEFLQAVSDPDLKRWYKGLPLSPEEDLKKLRKMWEIIKSDPDRD